MTIADLSTHKIGILGFGQEGQAVFKYLKKHGLSADVLDEKKTADYLDTLSDFTLLFRSPGVWRNHPKILEAEQNGIIVTSQTKLFFDNCRGQIVGVTGTKGKGTTCSLIYETAKAAGKKVYLTGNIGKIQPLEFLDDLTENDLVIYELSSFQLQDLTKSPHIGICLMVTSDHLNHHSNLTEYHSAKAAITAFQTDQDIAIYNSDYEASKKIGELSKGSKHAISANNKLANDLSGSAIIHSEKIEFSLNNQAYILDCSTRKLKGAHNLENIAASTLACLNLGIDFALITEQALKFTGLEHRLQYVGTVNSVAYYNDSISTIPETTIAALNSFDEPIHLLLGGSHKGLSYDKLVENIGQRKNIAGVYLLGEVGENLSQLFTKARKGEITDKIHGPYTDLSLAMQEIQTNTNPGDVVLLSPAAASFDMFKSYAQRGEEFIRLVKEAK